MDYLNTWKQKSELSKDLSILMSGIIRKYRVNKESAEVELIKGKRITKKDEYVEGVFTATTNMLMTLEFLHFVPKFIDSLKQKKSIEAKGISLPQYLQFHLESYIIKSSTILDQMVILTNQIYHLGISPKRCTLEILLDNYFTKNSEALKLIKNYSKTITEIKYHRNLIVHHGNFNDKELNKLYSLYIVTSGEEEYDSIFNIQKTNLSKNYILTKINELQKHNAEIEKAILDLHQKLKPIFNQKLQNFC